MTAYIFDNTLDGLLTAVFDAFALHEQPEALLTEGEPLQLFWCIPTRRRRAAYGQVWRSTSTVRPCTSSP